MTTTKINARALAHISRLDYTRACVCVMLNSGRDLDTINWPFSFSADEQRLKVGRKVMQSSSNVR